MDPQTIETYDKMAKEYDDGTIDFWDIFPRTIIDKFISLTKGKVLDVGSGPGRDGLLLKEKGLEVVCLDASEAMVKLSKEKGLESVIGDFNNLPFTEKTFDGVWAYTSLLHIPKKDIGKPLQEISRVLKTSGIFGLGLIEGNFEGYRESAGVNMPRWFSFYEKSEVEKLLVKHGFEIVYFEQFKKGSKNYLNFIARKIN
jgi:ubiquinone/menaquinone biosynthesis C-methylase UbiE